MDRDTLRARLTDDVLQQARHAWDTTMGIAARDEAMRTVLFDALCPPTPDRQPERSEHDRDACPDTGERDCQRCSGEYCDTHFTAPCDCDVAERHHKPERQPTPEPPSAPCLTVEALTLEVADLFDVIGWTVRGGRLRSAAKAAQESRQ